MAIQTIEKLIMKLPVQISFHSIPRSPEIEDAIFEHAERLDEFAERIMSCRVVVDVPHRHHQQDNLYQVRQLEDYVRMQRVDVKKHEPTPHARVARIFPQQDYGFLRTPDEREVYFHRNSVIDADFDHLNLGDEVTFVEEQGDKGPQASTVKPVGRHAGI